MSTAKNLFRLTAEASSTGEIRTLARSKSLANIADRLERDGIFWSSVGWECFVVEDSSLGFWSPMLSEDLLARYKRREISRDTYRQLRHHTDCRPRPWTAEDEERWQREEAHKEK